MSIQDEIRSQQHALWNGIGGQVWVETQAIMDTMLKNFERLLAEAVASKQPRNVLDVGCGTGATTLAAARRMAERAHATGIDISAPMIELARQRAGKQEAGAHTGFLIADAETHAFAPATYDMIISRFGVMFFADPVAAFSNLHHAACPGAALQMFAWRTPEENPFMTLAERTAATLLPGLPARDPEAPGQFAFASEAKVSGILKEAGWQAIGMTPVNVECSFPAADLDTFLTRLGPVGAFLTSTEPSLRNRVHTALRSAFAPYIAADTVRYTAACWQISAHAGEQAG